MTSQTAHLIHKCPDALLGVCLMRWQGSESDFTKLHMMFSLAMPWHMLAGQALINTAQHMHKYLAIMTKGNLTVLRPNLFTPVPYDKEVLLHAALPCTHYSAVLHTQPHTP